NPSIHRDPILRECGTGGDRWLGSERGDGSSSEAWRGRPTTASSRTPSAASAGSSTRRCCAKSTVIVHRESGASRGFGFVTFESQLAADSAIREMHYQELDGRIIEVNNAETWKNTRNRSDTKHVVLHKVDIIGQEEEVVMPKVVAIVGCEEEAAMRKVVAIVGREEEVVMHRVVVVVGHEEEAVIHKVAVGGRKDEAVRERSMACFRLGTTILIGGNVVVAVLHFAKRLR
ncbi:hypothetical protein EJB05_05174, partial [Eragrostis curvula]